MRDPVWLSTNSTLLVLAWLSCQRTWSERTGMATSGRHALRLATPTRLKVPPALPFVQQEFSWVSVDLPCLEARKAQPSGRPCGAGLPDL